MCLTRRLEPLWEIKLASAGQTELVSLESLALTSPLSTRIISHLARSKGSILTDAPHFHPARSPRLRIAPFIWMYSIDNRSKHNQKQLLMIMLVKTPVLLAWIYSIWTKAANTSWQFQTQLLWESNDLPRPSALYLQSISLSLSYSPSSMLITCTILNHVLLRPNKSSVHSNENAKQIWIDFSREFASNYIIQSVSVFCFSP